MRERWPSPREHAVILRDASPHARMKWISPLSPIWADVSRLKSRAERLPSRPPIHRPPKSKLPPSPALQVRHIPGPSRVTANGPPRPLGRETGRRSLRGTDSRRRVQRNPPLTPRLLTRQPPRRQARQG